MEPSSSSCHVTEIKHDVFISFRGTDVRKGLLSHLKKELGRRHIDTYVDDRLERGDEISPSLFRAIEKSQILLVVFSKEYASSKWCLEELAKMIECMERNNRVVLLPVFFNVDPSHVRNQLGEYGDAFVKHEETLKENMLKVQNWRSALNKAGHLSGFHYPTNYEDESDLVDNIVEDILEKLSKFSPGESNGLVGVDHNIAQIQSLLLMETSEVRFVGIWGMGGIGKTTIARAIFDKFSLQYDGCCILNVREELERQGLNHLRERLISELLEKEGPHTSGTSKARYINSAIRRLSRKKVFIVLDDVNTSEQLKKLVREGINFGPGSRVIITSRDKHVLTSGGVHPIYEVKKMDPLDSLKLFCLNAFNECLPKIGYEKLSDEVVEIAQGNPLALEVLGSYFHSMSSIETWRCALNKIKKNPHKKIQSVLRFSYDELHDFEKKAFLDIAFFFNKEDKDYVIRQLDSWGFYGSSGIEVLQQKALITISDDNRIQMHDLIREMGLEIVRQESPEYPERRSRLREIEDVYHVLRNNLGTDKVEAMQIDVKSQFADLLPLNVDTFKKMPRLRFLKFNHPLHTELCMGPSHIKVLLQDSVDSKGRDLNKSNMLVKYAHNSLRDESDLVDKIVEDIWENRIKLSPCESNGLAGIDHNIGQIQSSLLKEPIKVRFDRIWGMVRILRKCRTLLDLAIIDEYSHQYGGCYILNVREKSKQALIQALETISNGNRKQMHDLIKEMVWEIVGQEGHSQLRDKEGVYHASTNNLGTSEVVATQTDLISQCTGLEKLEVQGFNLDWHAELSMLSSRVRALFQGNKHSKRRDEAILSLEKQVASLVSGCEELKNVASEIHIKCLNYLVIDGWSGTEEFSVTSKETRQLSITQPPAGMEILNSSIGYLSNIESSDVDDQPFENLPKDLPCLRCTDYLKFSKSTDHEQDSHKPKLYILFDGLKVYKGKISFYHSHRHMKYSPLRLFGFSNINAIPRNISVFSWCGEFVVEESHARMLLQILPPGPIVCISTQRYHK